MNYYQGEVITEPNRWEQVVKFWNVFSMDRICGVYLMMSYLYEQHNVRMVANEEFKYICERLHSNMAEVYQSKENSFPFTELVDKEKLKSYNTALIEEYPKLLRYRAEVWYEKKTGQKLNE